MFQWLNWGKTDFTPPLQNLETKDKNGPTTPVGKSANGSYYIFRNTVDGLPSPDKQINEIIKIKLEKNPYLQASRIAYSSTNRSAALPFAQWTPELRIQAVDQLTSLGVPIPSNVLSCLYQCIQKFQGELCENKNLTYPALFKGCAFAKDHASNPYKSKFTFECQVYRNNKISLLFKIPEQCIDDEGSAKIAYKGYSLGKPKINAYLMSLPGEFADIKTKNEERYFNKLNGQPHIAKVYDIFYYTLIENENSYQQQIIEMKYYSLDLFKIINFRENHLTTDQDKMRYSLQLLEGLIYMQQLRITHRDIKPDNIFCSNKHKKIAISDFGLSTDPDNRNTELGVVGTIPYLAPEAFTHQIQDELKTDIWSTGCVLWHIWSKYPYPWCQEAFKERPNKQRILQLIEDFQSIKLKEDELPFLISKMLHSNPNLRWEASRVLKEFLIFNNKLPKENSLELSKQFEVFSKRSITKK